MSSAGCSYSSYEKESPLLEQLSAAGSHRVSYQPDDDWDFQLESTHHAIDISLTLPHYRAHNQPSDHRLTMFVGNDTQPIKLKVCRHIPRSKFYLEVQADTSDVTVWLPSDFKGRIHHSGRATYSAGFINRILKNVLLNRDQDEDVIDDHVVVYTRGTISFRMWDAVTCKPENLQKETIKRIFGCGRKNPETTMDWDFLLED